MTGNLRGLGLLLAVTLLSGCGGGADDDSGGEAADAAPPAVAEATPVESGECQSTMAQADTIATELETATIEDGTAFGQFQGRLAALYEKAGAQCSARVLGDFGAAMESMTDVESRYVACTFTEFQCDVSEDLIEGTGLIHAAAEASEATS